MSTAKINEDNATERPIEQVQNEIQIPFRQFSEDTRIRRLKLYRAALTGDWFTAAECQDYFSDRITKRRDTALHVAAAANQTAFARKLVERMTYEDLALKNYLGDTAFHYAASNGNLEIAKVMINKNKELAIIGNNDGLLPLQMAALSGHGDMVRFLYDQSNHDQLDEKEKMDLLVASINADLYDFALHLLKDYPDLASSRDRKGETALHALARKSETSSNFTVPSQQSIVGRPFKWISREKVVQNRSPVFKLVEDIWKRVTLLDDQQISQLIGTPWPLTFVAAEKGNRNFLHILISEYPDIIWQVDENGRTIFHNAVFYRQKSVFSLIYDLGLKDLIVSMRDNDGNSLLHLAAMLPPINRLNVVPGVAAQMRREVLWFMEVNEIMRPLDAEAENSKKKKPRELFVESHKGLKTEGETWIKSTANSCMVVATLVTTVVFAAAFTIPGGNKEETGAPNFLREVSFKIFFVADAISLVFSTISMLSFLSILTSTYAEEELRQLHKNLRIGVASLFMSIPAMMIAFCATCFIVLKDETPWIPILATSLASIAVLLFYRQQYRLFLRLFAADQKQYHLYFDLFLSD